MDSILNIAAIALLSFNSTGQTNDLTCMYPNQYKQAYSLFWKHHIYYVPYDGYKPNWACVYHGSDKPVMHRVLRENGIYYFETVSLPEIYE